LISLILAVVLVLGVFPMAGFATGEEDPVNETPAITQTPGDQTDDATPTPVGETATPTPVADETATPTPAGEDETATPTPVATPALPEETATPTPTPTPTPKAVVLADLSGEELYAYLLTLNEDELSDALGELTQEQIDSLDGYLTEDQVAAWFGEKIASAEDYAKVGPMLYSMDSLIAGAGIMAAQSIPRVTSNSIETSKTLTSAGGNNYNLDFSVYTTGTQSETEITVPTDVVLVLDQSSSMGMYSFTSQNYVAFDPSSNVNAYDNRSNLYVKNGSSYDKVTVSRNPDNNGKNSDYSYSSASGVPANATVEGRDSDAPNWDFYLQQSSSPQLYIEALREVVGEFLTRLQQNAATNGVEHRVAIVGFANGATGVYGYPAYGNSEILTVNGTSPVQYNSSGYSGALENALIPVDDSGSIDSRIMRAISQEWLNANGYTNSDIGMAMARDIFEDDDYESTDDDGVTRNKVVVLFTDGMPTYTDANEFSTAVANRAIGHANVLKSTTGANPIGATVYTIGIFPGADPTASITSGTYYQENRYMHYVSSNYPNATDMTHAGSGGAQTRGYYLSASTSSTLNVIFTRIVNEINGLTLTGATVKDFVTDDFDFNTNPVVNCFFRTYNANGTHTDT
ncbi:MAG: hypothetical protein AAGU32_09670, partial [Bacillota bacterium]